MDYITSALAQLSLTAISNLEYLGLDRHFPSIPRFAKTHNPTFFDCQALILQSFALYAYQLGHEMYTDLISNWRRSYADEEKAETFLMGYNVEPHRIIKDDTYWKALDIVTEWFRPKHLIHPVHFTDLRWYPWNLSTNAERPFTTDETLKKQIQQYKSAGLIANARMSFLNCYNEIFRYCRTYIHQVKDALPVPLHPIQLHVKPALVHGQKEDKVRTVFGVSKTLIFAEAMFFWPLFSHYFTEQVSPMLWNYETLNGGWYRLNDEWNRSYSNFKPIFNLDWSEFDMRVYFDMWQDCRNKVATFFCFCGSYCPTRTYPESRTSPSRLHNLWNWIGHAYFNTPCVSSTGKSFRRRFAGMPSGIFCTQFWDSFYNGVMVVTVLLSLGYEVTHNHFIKLMGDDVLFGLLQSIPIHEWADFLERFSNEAKRRFNSKLSPDKCGASQHIHGAEVLSYKNWNGYPRRQTAQLLAQLLHPKSLRDTFPRLMARSIGIYYASAGDPKIRPICEHIYSELKFLGYSPNYEGFKGLFDPLFDSPDFIDLDHFPSRTEVLSRLAGKSERNSILQSQYWDRTHFLHEAGSCRHQP